MVARYRFDRWLGWCPDVSRTHREPIAARVTVVGKPRPDGWGVNSWTPGRYDSSVDYRRCELLLAGI
jgi:hypothetical protein